MPTDPRNSPQEAKATGDIVEHPEPGAESTELGYETTDVNAGGIMVFLGGLFGFVIIFCLFRFRSRDSSRQKGISQWQMKSAEHTYHQPP